MNIYVDITDPFWKFINDIDSRYFSDIKSAPSYRAICEIIEPINGIEVVMYIREHPSIIGLHPNLIPHYTIKTLLKPNDSYVYIFQDINDAFYGMQDMMETTRNTEIANRIKRAIDLIEAYNNIDNLSDTIDSLSIQM